MSRLPPVVGRVRALQAEEGRWRAERPALALRTSVLDLLTSCGFQYYADHYVGDDVRLLDRAVPLLLDRGQYRAGTKFEVRSLATVEALDEKTDVLRGQVGDLDTDEELRARLVRTAAQSMLSRVDGESSADLICLNETTCLLEGVSSPYRCASRVSALGYFHAPDRYRVIDAMIALRQHYESEAPNREQLDVEIIEIAHEYVQWFASSTTT